MDIKLFFMVLAFLFTITYLALDIHSLNFIADDELDPYNEKYKEWEISGLYREDYYINEDDQFVDDYDYDSDDEDSEDDSYIEDD